LWLLLAAIALGSHGCPEPQDVVPDDDTTGDDDTTAMPDDDTTADDDTAAPDCETTGAWVDLLDEFDPQGDAGGYLVDIQELQVQADGGFLALRTSSWTPFDVADPLLMLEMYVSDGETSHALAYDNQAPAPGPLQLWSSSNGWAEPLGLPPSMCVSAEPSALVLGADLADLGFEDAVTLETWVGADIYQDYADEAPDGAFDYAIHAVIVLQEIPDVALVSMELDDAVSGDGDGVFDPGETLELTCELANVGYGGTGANLTGVLSLAEGATAAAALTAATATVSEGQPLEAGGTATVGFTIEVDAGAIPGQALQFELDLSDDAGNSWSLPSAAFAVAMSPVLADERDLDAPFDPAGVYFAVEGDDLHLMVTSHTAHEADQAVHLYLDVDRDGSADHALSTLDIDAGDYSGGVYARASGEFVMTGDPAAFDFQAGRGYVHFRVARADLSGLVVAHLYVAAYDQSGWPPPDYVPDDPSVTEDLGEVQAAEAPFVVLDSVVFSELLGDGDPYVDPGETWQAAIAVRNAGTADAASVLGELGSAEVEVEVLQGSVSFGALPMEQTATGTPQPVLLADPGAPETWIYTLDLAVNADGFVYDLDLEFPLGTQAADLAPDAPQVPPGTTVVGDTTWLADDYQDPSACTQYTASGNDGVYAVSLLAGETLELDLAYEAPGPDAVLYVSDDATLPDINCLDGVDAEFGEHESFTFTAPEDDVYYVVVDGYYAGGGAFTLQLGL